MLATWLVYAFAARRRGVSFNLESVAFTFACLRVGARALSSRR